MNIKSSLSYWGHKSVEILLNPKGLLLRSKGVVVDTYLKLDEPWFHNMNIGTVLDIGANIGRFSKTSRALLPDAQIYAFEPLPKCYDQLNKLMGEDSKFKSFNIGLGEANEILEIEQNDFTPSSSFLKMTPIHEEAFPFTRDKKIIQVPVKRLDDIISECTIEKSLMIKVDVQGFEGKVIMGGLDTFKKAKFLLLELSYQELYQGQPLFGDIYEIIHKLGFRFHGTTAQMKNPGNKEFLDADCLFIKKD